MTTTFEHYTLNAKAAKSAEFIFVISAGGANNNRFLPLRPLRAPSVVADNMRKYSWGAFAPFALIARCRNGHIFKNLLFSPGIKLLDAIAIEFQAESDIGACCRIPCSRKIIIFKTIKVVTET